MSNDNLKNEPKKGFPGGFFIFLLAAILVILTIQNLSNEKTGKVAFSHQVEHLVNLDLVQKDESRKIALNDNLVTFSGKFKERQSDDAKSRFRYLELLNRNHELSGEKKELDSELVSSKKSVYDASDLFLHLSGLPIPKGGYRVVDPIYNSASKENEVVIRKVSDKDFTSYTDLENLYPSISQGQSPAAVAAFGKDLLTLIEGFRSHALGIGNEAMKTDLRNIEQLV
ncbi:MAG: cell division protein FtsH, partial [Parachlamydiales bacterium]